MLLFCKRQPLRCNLHQCLSHLSNDPDQHIRYLCRPFGANGVHYLFILSWIYLRTSFWSFCQSHYRRHDLSFRNVFHCFDCQIVSILAISRAGFSLYSNISSGQFVTHLQYLSGLWELVARGSCRPVSLSLTLKLDHRQ